MAAVIDEMQGLIIWGVSDCCNASSKIADRIWGRAWMPGWLDAPTNVRDALKHHRQRPLLASIRLAMARSGFEPSDAHVGAMGVISCPIRGFGGTVAAVCVQPGLWAARTNGGFALFPSAAEIWGTSCRVR